LVLVLILRSIHHQTRPTIMSKSARHIFHVLIVDDSAHDRFLLRNALRRAGRMQIVAELCHGREVIAYFEGDARFSDRHKFPLPDLLLLDLLMPLMDGFEVLAWLKAQSFSGLTVVVLTDSMQPEHIKRALDLGADLFQVKPKSDDERIAMLLALEDRLLQQTMAMHWLA
jgi:CheY-like chemotaxis protein